MVQKIDLRKDKFDQKVQTLLTTYHRPNIEQKTIEWGKSICKPTQITI